MYFIYLNNSRKPVVITRIKLVNSPYDYIESETIPFDVAEINSYIYSDNKFTKVEDVQDLSTQKMFKIMKVKSEFTLLVNSEHSFILTTEAKISTDISIETQEILCNFLILDNPDLTLSFRDFNNKFFSLTREEVKELYSKIFLEYQTNFLKRSLTIDAINNTTSLEELDAIYGTTKVD